MIKISFLTKNDFSDLLGMEKKIYPEYLIQGQKLLKDIESGGGLKYSFVASEGEKEKVGYLVAVEDKTAKGEHCIYLEDIAVLPEFRNRGIAWEMLKKLVEKLQAKAKKESKPVLWNMHLREASRGLFEKHKKDLEKIGIEIIEEIFIAGYYDKIEDALYRAYQVNMPQ